MSQRILRGLISGTLEAILFRESLLACPLAKESQRRIYIVSDLVRDDCQPFRCLSSDLILIVFEPLFDVDEVGVESTLVPGVDHPNYEHQFDQPVEIVSIFDKHSLFTNLFD